LAAGCAAVFDLSGYNDAAETMCECPALSQIGNCTSRAQDALGKADADVREAWLARFGSKKCGERCDNADECFDAAPVCTPKNKKCSTSRECCGFTKSSGFCVAVTATQQTCASGCSPCADSLGPGGLLPPCIESWDKFLTLVTCVQNSCPDCDRDKIGSDTCVACANQFCADDLDACINDEGP
jgi:hypothetical protein